MLPTTIAVMAGTPVDTRMGRDFLLSRDPDLHVFSYPVSSTAAQQHHFQLCDPARREAVITDLVRQAKAEGAQVLLVYCNSLSGALDFPALCACEGLPVVTPLLAQQELAASCQRMGLLAANNQSLHGIERAICAAHNPPPYIFGVSLLAVVEAIEANLPPDEIVERFGLVHALRFLEAAGAEQVVLGCTHFPYLQTALAARTSLPIRNPDDAIFRLLFPASQ